ncbi:DUF2269 family protein [Ramlibacter tataouinensis]|uniref:Candidate membrane protein n=1 Tax=Ramlibacter tataouinensis (strain ATCC BAA-407 / DSM 14655 / LMG 21543 / TTB310) TaxID=365046 RepID=F5Y1L9_RAMTT|nr:DUF2269 domain-containing protein [Ramlibacter tataouinensis]AEG92270.1 candidate membrane protein [Ramlibacter tataouinensis TTB310]
MEYLAVKWVHILSSTVLFGTGIGSAFYLLAATLQRDVKVVAAVSRTVVLADWLFTATTAVLQPLTGLWLVHTLRLPLSTPWVAWSLGLYVFAIACWLPVVWIQMRLRDHAVAAAAAGRALPPAYWRLFTAWVVLGFIAFFAFLAIFWLMVAKRLPWEG